MEEAVSLAVSGIDMAVSDGAGESDPIGNVPTSNDEQHVVQEEQQQFFEEPQQMVMTSNEESNVASVGVMEEAPPAAMEAVEGNAAVMETVVAEPEMEAAVEEQQQHQEQHQEIYHQIEEAPQVSGQCTGW